MTVAVCLNCGELKTGAFATCPRCGFTPSDDDSLTRHLLVSDRYQTPEGLAEIAKQVKAGAAITFDPEALHAAWITKADLDEEARRLERTWRIGCGLTLTATVILLIVAAYLM